MNGVWVYEKDESRDERNVSMRRMDQEMNGWVYEKEGSKDEWSMSLWEEWIKR